MDIQKLGSVLICLFASQGIAAAATTLIAATSSGPYRSTDGGATWKQIFMNSDDPAVQRFGLPKLNSLAVDPQNPANVYAGATFTGVVAFLRSGDGGQTWSLVSQPKFGFDARAGALAIDPVMTNVIYTNTPQHEMGMGFGPTTPASPAGAPVLPIGSIRPRRRLSSPSTICRPRYSAPLFPPDPPGYFKSQFRFPTRCRTATGRSRRRSVE